MSNDETSRGVIRILTFAHIAGENSRLQLEVQLGD